MREDIRYGAAPAAPGRMTSGVNPGRMPGIPSGEAAKAQLRQQDAKQLTE